MPDGPEQVVYWNGHTLVTSRAVRQGRCAVPLSQIQGIYLLRHAPDYTLPAGLVILGLVLTLFGYVAEQAWLFAPTLGGLALVLTGLERLLPRDRGLCRHLITGRGTEVALPMSDGTGVDALLRAIDQARAAAARSDEALSRPAPDQPA
jgi:hypothetical protein